jgi:hypothetical protein
LRGGCDCNWPLVKIAFLLLGSGSGLLGGLSLSGCGLNSGLLNNWLLSWGSLSLNLRSGGLSHWDEAVGPLGRGRGGLVVSRGGVVDWGMVDGGGVVDGGVVDNGLGVVDWGGLVVDGFGGRLVVDGLGSRLVRSRLVLVIVSLALVFHVSNIAIGASAVSDDLDTAVGKVDPVLALGVVVVPVLRVAELGAGVVISNSVGELVDRGGNWLVVRGRGGGVVWSRGSWGGSGGSDQPGGSKDL